MLQETALRLAGSQAAAPGRGVQRGASLPGRRAAAAARHRAARDPARAVRAQYRAGHRAGGTGRAQGRRRQRDDPLLLVLPADHVIRDVAAFQQAVRLPLPAAEQGKLVTFGIVPHSPGTGYGYIQRGAR